MAGCSLCKAFCRSAGSWHSNECSKKVTRRLQEGYMYTRTRTCFSKSSSCDSWRGKPSTSTFLWPHLMIASCSKPAGQHEAFSSAGSPYYCICGPPPAGCSPMIQLLGTMAPWLMYSCISAPCRSIQATTRDRCIAVVTPCLNVLQRWGCSAMVTGGHISSIANCRRNLTG